MPKLSYKYKRGFTLIELLIVMAVLGVLAGMVIITFPAGTRRARDVQRKSDLAQYRTAIERFANENNSFYPEFAGGRDPSEVLPNPANDLCNDALDYTIEECPSDPRDGDGAVCVDETGGDINCAYTYLSDGSVDTGVATAIRYVLIARTEAPANEVRPYWIACSTGRAGYSDAIPTGGTCPITLTQ